jgi:ribA/ribD-fused uncharacterized protein
MTSIPILTTDFWKVGNDYGSFSNWSKHGVTDNDVYFYTTEHYLMYHKAILFKDHETAKKILIEKSPYAVKTLGRNVLNFDESMWNKKKYNIMLNGILLKVQQHKDVRDLLLSTGTTKIRETSDYDSIWGTGPGPARKGQNLLGLIWMNVRDILTK